MKKRTALFSVLLAALLFLGYAAAAGGNADDPLISLDYLKNVFAPSALGTIDQRLDSSDQRISDAVSASGGSAASPQSQASGWTERRFKQGDVITGYTGTQLLPLAGDVSVLLTAGSVVDATDAQELSSGTALHSNHRYLVAEDATAQFTVTSKTAVLDYRGPYEITPSTTPDYNAMASALKALSLFRGTGSGFGEGFELEKAPTRAEALVMLIRLLGEENAALSCTAPQPFSDVPEWVAPYVAYAYEKGYSNGVGDGKFGTTMTTSAAMYVEFILRALGYSSTAQTDISDALSRARAAGILTAGECAQLQSTPFLRADVAYLSYYALEVPLAGSGTTLQQKLSSAGVFTADAYRAARAQVTSARLW